MDTVPARMKHPLVVKWRGTPCGFSCTDSHQSWVNCTSTIRNGNRAARSALRRMVHGARTQTVIAWSGLTRDQLVTLRQRWGFRSGRSAAGTRHRVLSCVLLARTTDCCPFHRRTALVCNDDPANSSVFQGSQFSCSPLEVAEWRWDNVKHAGRAEVEVATLALASGRHVRIPYETGPAAMDPSITGAFGQSKYPIFEKLEG